MKTYTAANGTTFTDEDIERWGAEIDAGMPGWEFGKPTTGRPVSVGAVKAKSFSVRLDPARRQKVERAAAARNIKPSDLLRDLIDALPA